VAVDRGDSWPIRERGLWARAQRNRPSHRPSGTLPVRGIRTDYHGKGNLSIRGSIPRNRIWRAASITRGRPEVFESDGSESRQGVEADQSPVTVEGLRLHTPRHVREPLLQVVGDSECWLEGRRWGVSATGAQLPLNRVLRNSDLARPSVCGNGYLNRCRRGSNGAGSFLNRAWQVRFLPGALGIADARGCGRRAW